MRGDLPGVPPFIFHHTTTIPVRHIGGLFDRSGSGVDSAKICRVGIVDVNIEEGSHRATNSGVANHYYRIADSDLGWTGLLVFSDRPEHLFEEHYELFSIVNHDSWSNGVPAFRREMGLVYCLVHHTVISPPEL